MHKETKKLKNEQRVLDFLKKEGTPLSMACGEIARKLKIYNQHYKLEHPSAQGILNILLRLQKEGIITRDLTGFKQRIILNK